MTDDVNVKGLSQLSAFLDQLPAKMEKNVIRGGLRAGAKVVQVEAQANAHVHSSELRDGIKLSTGGKNGRVTASVKLTGPHAFVGRWLEYTGAAAHMIFAAKGKALAIFGGAFRSAQHPGFHAKPFLRPALEAKASEAVVATGNYIKNRLATKNGLDTADVEIEAQ